MKVRVFNKGKGWYVSASNYKDKEDKAYMNIHFSLNHCGEPTYEDNGRGFSTKELDIQEAIFTSYKGKIGLTVFKYEFIDDEPSYEGKEKSYQTSLTGNEYGVDGYRLDELSDDDLPFY